MYICIVFTEDDLVLFFSGNPPAPPEALPATVELIHALIKCSDDLPLKPKGRSKGIPLSA